MQLVQSNPSDIEVIFKPISKDKLKDEETGFIQDFIPQFNKAENPRYEIRSIQKVIARIVNESKLEWTYAQIRVHLFKKWRYIVSLERISEALANRTRNLSRYCKTNSKKQILMPK